MTNILLSAWLTFTVTTNWGPVEPSYSTSWPEGLRTTNYAQIGAVYSNHVLRFVYHGQEREVTLRSTCIADIGRSAEPWRFGDVWVRPSIPQIHIPAPVPPKQPETLSNLLKRLEKLLEEK